MGERGAPIDERWGKGTSVISRPACDRTGIPPRVYPPADLAWLGRDWDVVLSFLLWWTMPIASTRWPMPSEFSVVADAERI